MGGGELRSGRSVLKSARDFDGDSDIGRKGPESGKPGEINFFFGGVAEGWGESQKMRKNRVCTKFRPEWACRGRRRAEIGAFGTEIGS